MLRSEIYVRVNWSAHDRVHSFVVRSVRGGSREFMSAGGAGAFASSDEDGLARDDAAVARLFVVWADPVEENTGEGELTAMEALMPGGPSLFFGVDQLGFRRTPHTHTSPSCSGVLGSQEGVRRRTPDSRSHSRSKIVRG